MKKKALWKDTFREIRRTFPRFLSILLMVALGAFVLVGLRVTGPVMRESAEKKFKAARMYDLYVGNSLGLESKDLTLMGTLSDIDEVELRYSKDFQDSTGRFNIRLYSLPEKLSLPLVREGRLPKKDNELALDYYMEKEGFKIGDRISFLQKPDKYKPEGEETRDLTRYSFTIVGFVETPEQMENVFKGTSIDGTALSGFAYVMPDVFLLEEPTELRMTFHGTKGLTTESKAYQEYTLAKEEEAKYLLSRRPKERLDDLRNDVEKELDEGREKIRDARQKLKDGEEKLKEGREKVREGESEYAKGKREFNRETAKGKRDLAKGKKDLDKAKVEIRKNKDKIADGEKKLAEGKATLREKEEEYEHGRDDYVEGVSQYDQGKKRLEEESENLEKGKEKLDAAKKELDTGYEKLTEGEEKLARGKGELAAKEPELARGKQEYEKGLAQYYEGVGQLEGAKSQLAEGKAGLEKIDNGLAQAEAGKEEAEKEKAKALAGIKEAEKALTGLNAQLEELKGQKAQLEGALSMIPPESPKYKELQGKLQMVTAGIAKVEGGIEKVQKGKVQAQEGLKKAQEGIAKADALIQDLREKRAQVAPQVEQGEEKVAAGQRELAASKAKLDAAKSEIQSGEAQLAKGKQEIAVNEEKLESSREQLVRGQKDYDEGVAQWRKGSEELSQGQKKLDDSRVKLTDAARKLNEGKEKLVEGKEEISKKEKDLVKGKEELAEGEGEYKRGLKTWEEGQKSYDREVSKGRKKLSDAEKKLSDAKRDLKEGEEEYDEKKVDAEKDIAKGETDIDNYADILEILKQPSYTVEARHSNQSVNQYLDYSVRMDLLSYIFPVFFFIIAMLVSSTTMTRMVDENRTFLGTLKALGYTSRDISKKYLFYGASASLIGGILGGVAGNYILSWVIGTAYSTGSTVDKLTINFYYGEFFFAVSMGLFCTALVAWVTVAKSTRENAAELMRPKPPKGGNRILLERITPLWKRMSFLHKVTARNIFRYKKRMAMTLIGVMGCMALLVLGFGINTSVKGLVEKQYEELTRFDIILLHERRLSESNFKSFQKKLEKDQRAVKEASVRMEMVKTEAPGYLEQNVTTLIPEDEKTFREQVTLRKPRGEEFTLPKRGLVITEKLASIKNLNIGDEMYFEDSQSILHKGVVADITEGYSGHYMYMSKDYYESVFGDDYEANANLILLKDDSEKAIQKFTGDYQKEKTVISAITFDYMKDMMAQLVDSISQVVAVILVASSILAMVVLYNLTNINIEERRRELSTIKVLGFYEVEVTAYVYRETWILTLMGVLIGCVVGKILHAIVMRVVVPANGFLYPVLGWLNYAIPAAVTILISLVVMVIIHNHLKKIDMVEALKAVE